MPAETMACIYMKGRHYFWGGSLRTKHPALLNQNRKLQEQCPVAGYDKCSPDEFPVCELHRTPSCEQTWNQSEQLVHWKLVCCVAPPIGNLPASEDWMDANVTLGVPETRYASCIISVCTVLVKIRDPPNSSKKSESSGCRSQFQRIDTCPITI